MKILANIKVVIKCKVENCWPYYLHKFDDGYRWAVIVDDHKEAINLTTLTLTKDSKDAEWRKLRSDSFTTYITFPFSEEDLDGNSG